MEKVTLEGSSFLVRHPTRPVLAVVSSKRTSRKSERPARHVRDAWGWVRYKVVSGTTAQSALMEVTRDRQKVLLLQRALHPFEQLRP
jgi:hypothetical protein